MTSLFGQSSGPSPKRNYRQLRNKGPSRQGYGFSSVHVWMWELDCEESWVLKNWCFWTVELEKSLERCSDCKEIQQVHSKGDQPWVFFGRNDAKLKLQYFGHLMWRVDSLERTLMLGGIGAREEGDDRGWDGRMASLTRWTWVWVNSGSWWWTGRPGVLRFMGSQRVGHEGATELNWTEVKNMAAVVHPYECKLLPILLVNGYWK